MHEITAQDCSRIAQDLQIRKLHVESVVQLLDEGNTVPFIARYRKERTGGLGEEVIRQIQTRVGFLRQLAERKQTILKSIEGQGKINDELRQGILRADTTKRLEDLYLPYKPKKKSAASKAREQGLEPLTLAIWHSDPVAVPLEELLPALVNPEKELTSADDVRAGLKNILAEMMSETAAIRAAVRSVLWETGKICSAKNEKLPDGQGMEYKDYFAFSESARQIPPHRILALNRGEKEQVLKGRLEWQADAVTNAALGALAEHLLKEEGRMPAPAATAPAATAPAATAPAASPPSPVPDTAANIAGALSTGEAPAAEVPAEAPSEAAGQVANTAETHEAAGPTPEADAPATPPPPPEPSPAAGEALYPATASAERLALTGEPLVAGQEFRSPHTALLRSVLDEALTRLLIPNLEREIRRELTDEAESHAVTVFARNLRSLLLQPPLRHRRVLAIDPGFRTGCRVAALDEYGNPLEHAIIHPHAPLPRKSRAKAAKLAETSESKPDTSAPAPTEGSSVNVAAAPSEPAPIDVPSVEMITPAAANAEAPPADSAVTSAALAQAEPTAPAASQPAAATPVPANPVPATPAAEGLPETAPVAPPAATSVPSANEAPAEAAAQVDRRAEAKTQLRELISKHALQIVALGNGPGCRETEEIIAELIAGDLPDLSYVIVNEAGASVYATSPVGREEFPEFDAALRSTISIGRRLQDPLSELVKVEPHNLGVGLYQHDMGRKEMRESLDAVVESCVNQVGVDLNTASVPLLRHVSGLNQLVARELVDYRNQHGPFSGRESLLQVGGLGPARYTQAAGFLKVSGGPNPLDRTWIHPESYALAEKLLAELGYSPSVLDDGRAHGELRLKLRSINADDMARQLIVGVPTVCDVLQALGQPSYDPRDDLPPPVFKKGILKLEDMQPGMELKGTVLNVVDFGAFVDIGLKDSGLVHISQMANRYIKSPYDVVAVNDVVRVWVLTVDKERHRVSLSMIMPGTERKPPERKAPERRPPERRAQEPRPGEGGERRPPGRRHGGPPQGQGQGARPDHGRPPRGRGPGPGARRGPGGPPPGSTPAESAPSGEQPAAPAARVTPPPRRPRREPPKPKLTQAALEGKVPLRTFGELSALFAAKKEPEPKPAPAVVVPVTDNAMAREAAASGAADNAPGESAAHESAAGDSATRDSAAHTEQVGQAAPSSVSTEAAAPPP